MEGKYTGTRYVHAMADIEATIWYSKKERVYLKQEVEVHTEATETKYTININNFKINLWKKLSKFQKYDTIIENKKVTLFNNFYLPINIDKITNYEKVSQTIIYEKNELETITIKRIEEEIEKEIENKEQIKNKQINQYDGDGYIDIEVIYEVTETIGAKEKMIF